ncbi:MAG TPA: hypothetical protein VMT75_12730 [Candidatus Saccharimonadales bacterium]|nr:hypothetical protein [Candidatus Saccharimonadales bacterium]
MSTEHHQHGQTANGRPVHDDVSYEPRDVRTSPILKFLVYLGIVIVLSYALVFGIYRGLKSYWIGTHQPPVPSRAEEPEPTMPPEPRLQGVPGHLSDPQEDYRLKVEADKKANDTLQWVDEKAGIAEIPVNDAMRLIVEKGIPAIAPEEKK